MASKATVYFDGMMEIRRGKGGRFIVDFLVPNPQYRSIEAAFEALAREVDNRRGPAQMPMPMPLTAPTAPAMRPVNGAEAEA